MIDKCSETKRSDHIHKRTIEGTMVGKEERMDILKVEDRKRN